MRERGRSLGGLVGLAALLAAGPARADAPTVVVPPIVRAGPQPAADAVAHLSEGLSAVNQVARPVPEGYDARRGSDLSRAAARIDEGSAAYLELDLDVAAEALGGGLERLLGEPSTLPDAGGATSAALLLAQVHLARGDAGGADRVLARALDAIPGFPQGASTPPPPDVAARVRRGRAALDERGVELTVEADVAGAPVRINGAAVGETPVTVRVAPGRLGVVVGPTADGRIGRSQADVRGAMTVDVRMEPAPGRALAAAIVARDRGAAQRGLADIAAATDGRSVCVILLSESGALAARLGLPRGEVLGAHRVARPRTASEWRATGRLCAPGAPATVPPARVDALLFESEEPSTPTDTRALWGWGALGAGVVVAGVGTWLGVAALDAESEFHDAATRSDAEDARERARGSAIGADVSFVASAALVGTGLWLLMSDADP